MISEQQARAFADSWYAAWNAHDLGAIMSHYSPSIEHSSPFIKRYNNSDASSLRGVDAVREYFARALERNPTLRFDPERMALGLESVVLLYTRMSGDRAAETFFFDSAGKVIRSVSHYGLAQG